MDLTTNFGGMNQVALGGEKGQVDCLVSFHGRFSVTSLTVGPFTRQCKSVGFSPNLKKVANV